MLKKGERFLIMDYQVLVRDLRKLRWDSEKQAQHEFALLKLTLRGIGNLIRKVKVEALKVKKEIVPKEQFFTRKILRASQDVQAQDVIQLAKLVLEAITRTKKDVVYSFKLIAKFEREMKTLERFAEKLKKRIKNEYKYIATRKLAV